LKAAVSAKGRLFRAAPASDGLMRDEEAVWLVGAWAFPKGVGLERLREGDSDARF
jgi:hypothetical protein